MDDSYMEEPSSLGQDPGGGDEFVVDLLGLPRFFFSSSLLLIHKESNPSFGYDTVVMCSTGAGAVKPRRVPTMKEREEKVNLHKGSLLLHFACARGRNRWCNDQHLKVWRTEKNGTIRLLKMDTSCRTR